MHEYVERALSLGLEEFGFSDHSHWMPQARDLALAMQQEELDDYVRDVERLRERYETKGGSFRIRLGLEMDYTPWQADEIERVNREYPWDFLIGSIHHLGLWAITREASKGPADVYEAESMYEAYFGTMRQMIEGRFCDILGHLDMPKRHDYMPPGGLMRWVEPLIPALRKAEMVVEVNTSALDYGLGGCYPAWEIVEALHAAGVPLMVNSDAHAPHHVGRHFEPVLARLREIGVTHLARFEQRVMSMTPLPAPDDVDLVDA